MRPDKRIRVKREPHRGRYDRETIDAILDEALICHLGFEVDGQPYVIPTLHARVGDKVYVHGSAASRMLRQLAGGVRVCLTVTLFDGLVLARSVFNHSVNYRSVVVLGTATLDRRRREASRRCARSPSSSRRAAGTRRGSRPRQELKATWILSLPIDEASAKVRTGRPEDDPEDEHLPVWAGVVPVHLAAEPSEYDWKRVHDGRVGPPPAASTWTASLRAPRDRALSRPRRHGPRQQRRLLDATSSRRGSAWFGETTEQPLQTSSSRARRSTSARRSARRDRRDRRTARAARHEELRARVRAARPAGDRSPRRRASSSATTTSAARAFPIPERWKRRLSE